jgi:hypothetical protein
MIIEQTDAITPRMEVHLKCKKARTFPITDTISAVDKNAPRLGQINFAENPRLISVSESFTVRRIALVTSRRSPASIAQVKHMRGTELKALGIENVDI